MHLGIFKKLLVAFFLGAVVIFAAGAYCSKGSSTPVSTSSVQIKNMAFNPQTISVNAGTVVTWTNNDSTTHQIESDGDLPELLSGEIAPKETFVFTFDQAGTFKYHCKIHPSMTGTVIVK